MNILVMGLGFVGLTTALGLAEKKHSVFGFDSDAKKMADLAVGKVSLSEPELAESLSRNLGKNFNLWTTPLPDAGIDVVFICVGTPCNSDGAADLRYIYSALDMLEPILRQDKFNGIVVIKSTVPPNTTKAKIIPYLRAKEISVPIANNPEFLREGFCWNDFMNPDRIVCGVDSLRAADVMKAIYKDFDAPIIVTSLNTAEFIKYLSNTMLANMISFSNEMSMIARAIGDISIKQAFETLHMDRRWGESPMRSYVYPGCGFGGYCLPKDLSAMISQAKQYDITPSILEGTQSVNQSMPSFFVEQIIADSPDSIGILGLSFKPGSDDVRDSPASSIISALLDKNYSSIYVYDPEANAAFQKAYSFPIDYCDSVEEICGLTATIMIVTAWPQFRGIDKKHPNVRFIDGRYML